MGDVAAVFITRPSCHHVLHLMMIWVDLSLQTRLMHDLLLFSSIRPRA